MNSKTEMDGVVVLPVSALWQSTGVAKAQKQIQTIPTNSHPLPVTWRPVSLQVISLHTRATRRMQVGVFAQGLSLIVHIKYDKDTPPSTCWSRKRERRERGLGR